MTRNLLEEAGINYKPSNRNLLEEAGINYSNELAPESGETEDIQQKYFPTNKQELGDFLRSFSQHQPISNAPTSAVGAGLRAAGRLPYSLAERLGVPKESLVYPSFIQESEYDRLQHPFAEFIGESAVPFLGLAKKIGLGSKAITGLSKVKDIYNIKNLGKQLQESEEAHEASLGDIGVVKEAYGKSSIPSIRSALDRAMLKKSQLEQRNPNEIPLEEQEQINLSNRLPGATGESLVPEAQSNTTNIESQIQRYLGHGEQQHDVDYQNSMNQLIRQGRSQLSEGYNDLRNQFNDRNVEITSTKSVKDIQQELRKLISEGGYDNPEARELANQLQSADKGKTVPASKLLTQFQTADKLAKLATQKSFERNQNLTQEQREFFSKQAEQFREQAEKIASLLEEQVNPEFRNQLQQLNSGWRQYASLYKNPLARKIESGRGISGNNILNQLRGEDIGQRLLRSLTLSNPEANHAAIAHTYASNPRGLLESPQYEQQFIQQNTSLPQYQRQLQESIQGEQRAQKLAFERQEEAYRVERAYQEDVELEKIKSEAKKIASEIEKWNQAIKDFEKALKNEKLTLKEKMEIGARLNDARKNVNRLKSIGKKALGYSLIAGIGDTAINKFLNIFK